MVRERRASGSPTTNYPPTGGNTHETKYFEALRKGLENAVGIEALDSITPASREFESEVLQALARFAGTQTFTVPGVG